MKKSPVKNLGAVVGASAGTSIGTPEMMMISAGAQLLSGMFGSRRRRKQQRQAQARYDEMKKAYQGLDTSNIYADVQNPYAGMENTMEDLRVNTQQADFIAQQGAQSRADILGGLRRSAGGSGIAALAQAMANQGQLQAQRASASIGQQEAANERLSAQGQLIVQQGEQAAMGKRIEGDIMSREWEKQRTQTLLGMSQQETAAHNQAAAQARAQQTAAWGDIAGGIASGVSMGMTDKMPISGGTDG